MDAEFRDRPPEHWEGEIKEVLGKAQDALERGAEKVTVYPMTDTDKLAALLDEMERQENHEIATGGVEWSDEVRAEWLTERGVGVSKGIAERGQTTPSGAESPETDTTTPIEPSEAAALREALAMLLSQYGQAAMHGRAPLGETLAEIQDKIVDFVVSYRAPAIEPSEAAKRAGGFHEIRLDGEGKPDDIVLRCDSVHLERMDDDSWWLGVYLGGKRVALGITRSGPDVEVTVVENETDAAVVPHRAQFTQETGDEDAS